MKRTILHVFDINSSPETVIKALSEIEGLKSWWTSDVSGSPKEGGIINFRFGNIFKPDMKVVQISNNLVRWQCMAGSEKAWEGDMFSFIIDDSGELLKMTFTQEYSNEITDEQYGRFNFN